MAVLVSASTFLAASVAAGASSRVIPIVASGVGQVDFHIVTVRGDAEPGWVRSQCDDFKMRVEQMG